jgi:arylsulfatase A-like enzyme
LVQVKIRAVNIAGGAEYKKVGLNNDANNANNGGGEKRVCGVLLFEKINIMETKKLLICGIGSCLSLLPAKPESNPKAAEEKPNVLFIVMDDMCDWVGFLGGNNQALTPNLNRLAERGVVFSNAYTAVPLSNPSRTALMTGMQPFVTGVYNNTHEISNFPAANGSVFMPRHFHDNGYKTIIAGKIFHTKPSTDVMNGMWDDAENIDGGYGPFIKNQSLPPDLQQKWKNYEIWTGPDSDFADVRNSQRIINYLKQTHNKPFFAAMGFYRPHNPYTAPKRYFDLYDLNAIRTPESLPDDLDDVPAYAINHFVKDRDYTALLNATGDCARQLVRAYLACVSFADDRIGMILDALDASAYADNTYIVLVGDNGFHHGEKEHWGKADLWREACHVPFVIVPPRSMNVAPKVCSQTVNLIDVYPTLVELCHLPPVENQLAGNSLQALLNDAEREWNQPSVSTFLPGNFVIHLNQWNYIRYANGAHELYNTATDENEYTNLANKLEYQYMVDSLAKYLPTEWYTPPADLKVESVSEDISTPEWESEITRLNPSYVRPATGSSFDNINSANYYFDKYLLKGAVVNTVGTPNCAMDGVTHGDAQSALAFRLKNDSSGYFEFPTLYNAGMLTLHIRSGATGMPGYLSVQKYDEVDWTTLACLDTQKQSDYNAASIDEIITCPININEDVKLRIRGGNRFTQIFRIDITPYRKTDLQAPALTDNFHLHGRRLSLHAPSHVSVYNAEGIKVFEKYVERETSLPASIGSGVFLIRLNTGTQKIHLK